MKKRGVWRLWSGCNFGVCRSAAPRSSPLSAGRSGMRTKRLRWSAGRGCSLRNATATPRLRSSPLPETAGFAVYLSRTLKRELGETFVAFLTGLCIRKAIQLLNATDLTIHEIAGRVGYDSQHYFSTAFKRQMGVSPNQYRRGDAFRHGAAED